MTSVLLTVILLAAGLSGYWVMAQVDRFLDRYVVHEEEADEPENSESA